MKKIINTIRLNFNEYHFILIWTLLNIIQIGTTELTSDEGYYWFYSSKLEWGYYDHPPLLAFLIKLGTSLVPGEMGVRLFNVLLMSIGLIFLFKIDQWNKRGKTIIYLILLSIPLFNYITFIAFPDTPLIAFSIICLYAYKRLINKNDLFSSLLFGVSIAFMLYSKYHAVIFVLFILLSNLSLLRNKYFYLSIILSCVLFIPHLLWQYQHDFPSFQYHLYGRANQFEFANLFEFISQQIPMIGIGIIFVPFIYKPENQFDKTLKYITIGTFIFFLLNTFRGFVHLHWTSIMLFPIIILSAKFYLSRRNNRLLIYLTMPFLIMILLVRIYLATNILPINTLNVDYYHGRKQWAEDIETIAGKRPVVFETGNGALREAPLYSFYSKNLGIAFYPGGKKKSQYQIWNYEDTIQSKNVIIIKRGKFEGSQELQTRMGVKINYKKIDSFTSFNNIRILCNEKDILNNIDSILIPIHIINHRQYPLCFTNNHKIYISLRNVENKEFIFIKPFNNNLLIKACDTAKLNFKFSPKEMSESKYDFIFGIIDGITDPSINSTRNKLIITNSETN
ncbi:MAG: glycosyltransferase family 39 protein [Bacteroidales bacterium]|nr:glycosyltransferase family 39 protein [Bacteroidales bacterium]